MPGELRSAFGVESLGVLAPTLQLGPIKGEQRHMKKETLVPLRQGGILLSLIHGLTEKGTNGLIPMVLTVPLELCANNCKLMLLMISGTTRHTITKVKI